MASERVACSKCKGWMFHLAKRCPHCGAENSAAPAKMELSQEEARALLQSSTPPRSTVSFSDIASATVMPREGVLELVLSVLAAPLTASTVLTLGYFLLRQKRSRRDDALAGAQLLAVPVCAALFAVTLFELDAPPWAWGAFAFSFAAWAVRALRRQLRAVDPLA